jgi:glucose-6-phosphate isomerase
MPPSSPTCAITTGPLTDAFVHACGRLDERAFAEALWREDPAVWSDDPATQRLVAGRLGWLREMDAVTPHLARLRTLASDVARDGVTEVVLLGMGGSSLAREVMRRVIGPAPAAPRFHVLDSVDPDAVRAALAHAGHALFVLASKSGSTIEPNAMAAEAQRRVVASGRADWGSRFLAITDEGTALHRRAVADGFREVFVNPSDIGGRYSALSLFGMVPAALMGLDLDALLDGARAMDTACRETRAIGNPGLALGALMAAGAVAGRDKLTLMLPGRLEAFGLWVEQLVAESTGKHGTGVVPVAAGERPGEDAADRVLVTLVLGARHVHVRERLSGPRADIVMPDASALGAEFLRWEIATATAGWLLGINPFDEPNVQQAKDATRALLETYDRERRLPAPAPDATVDEVRWSLSEPARGALAGAPVTSFLQVVRPHDYVALLAYLPPEHEAWHAPLEALRAELAERTGCATTLGYGPRYLHSTGQLHKGGANNGVFIVVTADGVDDLDVPGEPFSFGVLEAAQAIGDFQSLERTGRRALFLALPRRDATLLGSVAGRLGARG